MKDFELKFSGLTVGKHQFNYEATKMFFESFQGRGLESELIHDGKVAFDGMSDKTILCSGTVLGSSKGIKEYLRLLKKYGSDFKYKKKFKYLITFRPDPEGRGCEQGHANYLVHKKIIKDYHLYSNSSGPVATVFYLKKIIFDNESRLINDNGEPYLLVHQYDKRWNEFSQNVKNFKNNL